MQAEMTVRKDHTSGRMWENVLYGDRTGLNSIDVPVTSGIVVLLGGVLRTMSICLFLSNWHQQGPLIVPVALVADNLRCKIPSRSKETEVQ